MYELCTCIRAWACHARLGAGRGFPKRPGWLSRHSCTDPEWRHMHHHVPRLVQQELYPAPAI